MKHATIDWPPRYEVIGTDGQVFGPFASESRAALFATIKWPQQERDRNYTGRGWSILQRGRYASATIPLPSRA
jgi:hypothetical protein